MRTGTSERLGRLGLLLFLRLLLLRLLLLLGLLLLALVAAALAVVVLVLMIVLVALEHLRNLGKILHAHLGEDGREEISELLVLAAAGDRHGVGLNRRKNTGVSEVQHSAVVNENVRLLNALKRTETRESTESRRKLRISRRGGLVHNLLLSANRSLAASADLGRKTLKCGLRGHVL